MRNLKSLVEDALKADEASRNSDIRLTNYIWINHYQGRLFKDKDGDWCIKLKEQYNVPTIDDVKRCRALFNHKGLYMPTDPEVLKRRTERERRVHNEMAIEKKRDIRVSL